MQEISWLIVCSDGDAFEGEFWTVQCENIWTKMLGGAPADEDEPSNMIWTVLFLWLWATRSGPTVESS